MDRDLARFAAALEETARARRKAKADEAAAAEHARQLAEARTELDRAIAEVRAAKAAGRATAEADLRWRTAKANVIELETGIAPAWGHSAPSGETASAESADATYLDEA